MKITTVRLSMITVVPLFLVACAATPMGPTVQVMPSSSKPFQVFQQDQEMCKQYAQSQVSGQADAANQRAVGGAVLGTALGAAFGAAVGDHRGAAAFGSAGAIAGTAGGASASSAAQLSIQDQYNNAYTQCMYSRGNQVPGAVAEGAGDAPQNAGYAPPPPPPPPGQMGGPGDAPMPPMTTRQAQARLNAAGYAVGSPDGVFGARSRQQLKRFQADNGLTPTGELDPNTVAALSRF